MLYSFNFDARLNVFENSHQYDNTLYQHIFISTLSTPYILINASWLNNVWGVDQVLK